MRPPSPSLPERDFTLSALKHTPPLRLDGRSLSQLRPLHLSFGPQLGWVECALGKTRVLAYVDAKMVRPPPERGLEGLLSVHCEISPMAGRAGEYEVGRTSDQELAVTRTLDKLLRNSSSSMVLDRESLCILAGQRVWHVRLTLHFLSDAGNLLDCACLAAVTALRHFRRPDVEVLGEEVVVHPPSERAPIPLSLHYTPYCLTFAHFSDPSFQSHSPSSVPAPSSSSPTHQTPSSSDPTLSLLDPTHLEQTLSSLLTIALTSSPGSSSTSKNQTELVLLQKFGGLPLSPDEILRCVQIGAEKVKEVDAYVQKRLKEDWEERKGKVEGL